MGVSVKTLWGADAQTQGSPGSLSQPPIIIFEEVGQKINLFLFCPLFQDESKRMYGLNE